MSGGSLFGRFTKQISFSLLVSLLIVVVAFLWGYRGRSFSEKITPTAVVPSVMLVEPSPTTSSSSPVITSSTLRAQPQLPPPTTSGQSVSTPPFTPPILNGAGVADREGPEITADEEIIDDAAEPEEEIIDEEAGQTGSEVLDAEGEPELEEGEDLAEEPDGEVADETEDP